MGKTETQYLIEWLEKQNQINNELIARLRGEEKQLNLPFEMQNKYIVKEFAEIINCSIKTVYALIKRKDVHSVTERIRGRKIMFVIANSTEIERLRRLYAHYPKLNF